MTRFFLFITPLLFLFVFSCNLFDEEINSTPTFVTNESISDTVLVGSTFSMELLVNDDDTITFTLTDSTIPFRLINDILTIDPTLTDTGFYDFFVVASDPIGQTDSLHFTLTICPEYVNFNKIVQEVRHFPGGVIECGQSTSDNGDADSTIRIYEFNEFGYISKFYRASGSSNSSSTYEYTYDSLGYPSVMAFPDNNSHIDYIYDNRGNLLSYIYQPGAQGNDEPDTMLFTYNENNQMLSCTYSYQSSINTDGITIVSKVKRVVTFSYDSNENMCKAQNTDDGIPAGYIEYDYSNNGLLTEKRETSNGFTYLTTYENNLMGQRIREIAYHGTGELARKSEYTYTVEGKPFVIDEFCWNYTHYNSTCSIINTWQNIKVIKTPATNTMVDDLGMEIRKNNRAPYDAISFIKEVLTTHGKVCLNL